MITYSQDLGDKDVLKFIESQSIVMEGNIDGNADAKFITDNGTIEIRKDINSQANLLAIARDSVTFSGEFNSNSSTKLESKEGMVIIGKEGEQKNLNSHAKLTIIAKRKVIFYHTDFNGECEVNIKCLDGGVDLKGDINSKTKITITCQGNINLDGDINSNALVTFTSTRGGIYITGHVHSNARLRLIASNNISIDKEVDGNLSLMARCEGFLTIGGAINNNVYAELRAHNGIHIKGNISDNSKVKVSTIDTNCTIDGDVDNSTLDYTTRTLLSIGGNGNGNSNNWITEYEGTLIPETDATWWNNWGWTYGYASNNYHKPKSYQQLVSQVAQLRYRDRVKGVGGGWSFSDASLPHDSERSVFKSSIFKRGENNTADLRYTFRFYNDPQPIAPIAPMDMYPFEVMNELEFSGLYDLPNLRKQVHTGMDLKLTENYFHTIDTRNLASSLQCNLKKKIVFDPIHGDEGKTAFRYWVEAGVTISDLNVMLDHNFPRLALEASGGSPGATLAGTISTATHGGEFQKKLLVDRIVAVHLIGPGGEEWWFEGSNDVIAKADLQLIYPNLTDSHFVAAGNWTHPTLSADDMLKAVVTSMGTMGIIYSVVLEVVPQYSIRQVSYKYQSWYSLLEKADVKISELEALDGPANLKLMDFLMDGSLNQTGISKLNNQYVDLAINPIGKSCWVVNREFLSGIADDENSMDLMSNYLGSFTSKMTEQAYADGVMGSELVGRILDFLSIPRALTELPHEIGAISNFLRTVNGNSGMLLSSLMALIQKKAIWNQIKESNDPPRGHIFLNDILEAILDALQGTFEVPKAEIAGLSYKVGAIGWPGTGMSGRGFEVAVAPTKAFSYIWGLLKKVNDELAANNAFLGYISIRICPPTQTLLGMQQFGDYSIMVEVVAHRTPESSKVFQTLIDFSKTWEGFAKGEFPPFHWGLETEMMDKNYLEKTPFGGVYKANLTRLEVFKMVKDIIMGNQDPIFDNYFVSRMGF